MTYATLITPTRLSPSRDRYLNALYDSIIAASPRYGFEWIIAVDGENSEGIPDRIVSDSRVRVLTVGRSVGAATARNIALQYVTTELVTSIDDDDLLPPNSLDLRTDTYLSRPEIRWVGGLLTDLLEDDSTSTWDCPAKRGLNLPGDIWRRWESPDATFPIGPTTLLIETDLVRALGGWQGLPQGEDFGMVMAVTSTAPGFVLNKPVYLYRKHSEQMTRTVSFDELEPIVRSITHRRGALLSESK